MTMQPIATIIKNKRLNKPKEGNFEGLPIRPSKKNTRWFVDNEYYERGYAAIFPKSVLLVYGVLAKYANQRTQTCFPSINTIMREGGIKNRNTAVNALKILEAYNIILTEHSKGWYPNHYALLKPEVWKPINSISIDTIIKTKKTRKTVSEIEPQQYQNQPSNSISDDTRNQLSKSSNEIKDENKNNSNNEDETRDEPETEITYKDEDLLSQLSTANRSLLRGYYHDDDIVAALRIIRESGVEIRDLNYKPVIETLKKQGAKPLRELDSWMKV